jgi:hypothetical protein
MSCVKFFVISHRPRHHFLQKILLKQKKYSTAVEKIQNIKENNKQQQ